MVVEVLLGEVYHVPRVGGLVLFVLLQFLELVQLALDTLLAALLALQCGRAFRSGRSLLQGMRGGEGG